MSLPLPDFYKHRRDQYFLISAEHWSVRGSHTTHHSGLPTIVGGGAPGLDADVVKASKSMFLFPSLRFYSIEFDLFRVSYLYCFVVIRSQQFDLGVFSLESVVEVWKAYLCLIFGVFFHTPGGGV